MFQDGEYLLREGEELGSNAKFYLIDSGAVHCYKTFEVRMQAFGNPAGLGAPIQGFCTVHIQDQDRINARSHLLFFPIKRAVLGLCCLSTCRLLLTQL